MPEGIPLHLSRGDEGYSTLCELLGIETTKKKQEFASQADVKGFFKRNKGREAPSRLPQREKLRHKVLAFYSNPKQRRLVWIAHWKSESDDDADSDVRVVASLEHEILTEYGVDLLAEEPDPIRLEECTPLYESEREYEPWQAPALAVLPDVKEQIQLCSTLESEERRKVAATTFAIASVLEDARVLYWAAQQDDYFAQEFSFLPSETDVNEELLVSSTEPDVFQKELQSHVNLLIDAANALATKPPTPGLFDLLAERYSELESLRQTYTELSGSDAVARLISEFIELLHKRAPEAGWLADEISDLEETWRRAYRDSTRTIVSDLERDLRRAEGSLHESCELVKSAQEAHAGAIREEIKVKRATKPDELHGTTLSHLSTLQKAVDQAESNTQKVIAEALAELRPEAISTETMSDSPPRIDSVVSTSDDHSSEDSSGRSESVSRSNEQSLDKTEPETVPYEIDPSIRTPTSSPLTDPPSHEVEIIERAETQEPLTNESISDGQQLAVNDVASLESDHVGLNVASPDIDLISVSSDRQSTNRSSESTTKKEREQSTQSAPMSPVHAALWSAIGTGRISLAYHIARLAHENPGDSAVPDPDLVAVVLLGSLISGPDSLESEDDLASEFNERVNSLLERIDFDGIEPELRDALNLLLIVAALRPGLFATQTGSSLALLHKVELSSSLAPLYELTNSVLEHARKLQGVYLNTTRLAALLDEENWRECISRHIELVDRWKSQATYVSFQHPPANLVWQRWLKKGVLNDLVKCMTHELPTLAEIGKVKKIVDMLNDSKGIHKHIDETDVQERRRGERLYGSAKNHLARRLKEPLELARTWLDLTESRRGTKDFVKASVESLHSTVVETVPKCLDAIATLRSKSQSTALVNALNCAEQSITSFRSLFEIGEDISVGDHCVRTVQAFTHDLLLVSDLRVDVDGEIIRPTSKAEVLELLINTKHHANSLLDAFDYRIQLQDLYIANAICERMDAEFDENAEIARNRLTRAIDESRNQLLPRLEVLAEQLEQAFVIGEISDVEHAVLNKTLQQANEKLEVRQVSGSEDFNRVLTVPNNVESLSLAIEPAVERGIEKLKLQLDDHEPREDEHETLLIQDAIEGKDLATLYEVVDCLHRNQTVAAPNPDACATLADFLEVALRLENESKIGVNTITIEAVSKRRDILGIEYSSLSAHQAKRSAQILEQWYKLSRKANLDDDSTMRFFSLLGFSVNKEGLEIQNGQRAILNVEPLRQRELCPIHVFGSKANGRYALAFNWETPVRDRIVQAIRTDDPNTHTIVLHFGKLGVADREWLRNWSIEHRTPFIVLDEILILYLASFSDGLLRALFRCTLPFTCSEPYYIAPGLVPPESFYGRERERQIILDPDGSCFVYGGRQLGKTALLHSAKAAFHDPASHHLAEFIDLRYEGVGTAYGAGEIWVVLWRIFKDLGVIGDESEKPPGRDGLTDAIKQSVVQWLNDNSERRILLLLDEADAFLESDRNARFDASTSLKGLMDETGRRFKVVLCGLHNVLRNTERANHPFAHLGEPVCIGPLLNNADLNQARTLIREPMATIGYKFESDNLITRILLWTNYFPSLIQLFGDALVTHMRERATRHFPQVISSEDLQTVINRDQFRERIRERFIWTLQLDPRYEVVAYAMALELRGEENAFTHGLSIRQILYCVRDYWPEGFDTPTREFETLLQEMCGLGVLQHLANDDGSRHFVFRNPNVISLLGDDDRIQDVLTKQRSKPEVFDTASYHAPFDAKSPRRLRFNPLTYEQEALLKRGGRVGILCGTNATEITETRQGLNIPLDMRLRQFESNKNARDLSKQITALRPGTDTYIYFVDDEDPWTFSWVRDAVSDLKRIQRGQRIRVVFTALEKELWRLIEELPDRYLYSSFDDFDWMPVQPWNVVFIQRWCNDLDFQEAYSRADLLWRITGGWPVLMNQYAMTEGKTWEEKERQLKEYIKANQDEILRDLGLESEVERTRLKPMLAWGTLPVEEIDSCADLWSLDENVSLTSGLLRRHIFWATKLGLMHDDHDGYKLNPLVESLLQNCET